MSVPTLREGAVTLRPIRLRDARVVERELMQNRRWLRQWEATSPHAPINFDMRASIRNLLAHARAGTGLPFVMEHEGEVAGQLNVSSITGGSLASASIGYWVSERFAGLGVTPVSVALATDYCFSRLGLHRMEICIRPENGPSLRVVEKLGFRYEGLRRRFIHINGDWRDHFSFALVSEEMRQGVLQRFLAGEVPTGAAEVPAADRAAAANSIVTVDRF